MLFLLHATLIASLLAGGAAALIERSGRAEVAEPAPVAAVPPALPVGPPPVGDTASLGPLSGPPSVPVSLDAQLRTKGYTVPGGANVYAVRIAEGPKERIYEQYQAGGGALAGDFWPASSIKVLAALGALDFVRTLGFTGAAKVTFGGGASQTLRSIYEPAIRDSSNYDYDLLVRIAGLDHLNFEFLTARNGFPITSISRSYTGLEFQESPPMTLEEGGRRIEVPARTAELQPECSPGNCSNLFEMTESVRRIVLDEQLPPEQRFNLDPTDLKALSAALLKAEGFFPDAVARSLGTGARIWSKPGDAANLDCLDVAMIQSRTGRRFLLAASVPHESGGCVALSRLARGVLELLSR